MSITPSTCREIEKFSVGVLKVGVSKSGAEKWVRAV